MQSRLTTALTILCTLISVSAWANPYVKLVPSELYLTELEKLLDTVESGPTPPSIDILHFNFFTETGRVREIAERLKAIKVAHPSIEIRILLEGEKDLGKPKSVAARNQVTRDFFAGTGIDVRFISGVKDGAISGVTHAKAIRVGNKILSGSTNLTNTSVEKNNEFNTLIDSAVLATEFRAYLDQLVKDSTKLVPVSVADGAVTLLTDSLFLEAALELVNAAKAGESLDLTTYFFAYRTEKDVGAKRFFEALTAAQVRGVNIRVYLERNGDPTVSPDITKANFQAAERLTQAGIAQVYFDPDSKISHSKIIKYVGREKKVVLLGSTNIYRGDFEENHQVNLRIENADLSDQLTAYLNQKFAYEATSYATLKSGLAPPRMLRFWRGFAQADVAADVFKNNLNGSLVPETMNVGAERGLLAYLPALFGAQKPASMPDEIALIAYSSEDTYNAIRTTPKGAEYGPLHFSKGMFTRETANGYRSGSLVAVPYQGTVASLAAAYSIEPESVDWQSGQSVLRALLPSSPGANWSEVAKKYLDDLSKSAHQIGASGAVVLVDQNYVLALLNFESPQAAQAASPALDQLQLNRYTTFKSITHESQANGSTQLNYDAAISVRFKTELLSPRDAVDPVIKAMKSIDCEKLARG